MAEIHHMEKEQTQTCDRCGAGVSRTTLRGNDFVCDDCANEIDKSDNR